MAGESTFSESWYRIKDRRVGLRPHVRIQRQYYRGEQWHVLEDPFGNQYFRLRPAVYTFIARLDPSRTVEAIWQECLQRYPDEAPGQEEVIRLLAQLFHANLIQSDSAADTVKLFERYRERRRKEVGKRILTIMFARFHVLDPDRFLCKMLPLVRPLISPAGILLWLVVGLLGVKAVLDNAGEFASNVQGVLAPGNLALLYLALVILKTLHEYGHAFVCRHFGGEVHDMGIMLLVFTPLPYVNATAAWAFRERWKRVLVGASGMVVELFVAAIAAMVWASTGTGTINALAYNMVLVASVSTLVFNANPLLRFDGYYILSDLIDVPNLHKRAGQAWRYWVERYWFGMREQVAVEAPSKTRKGLIGLGVFGAMAFVYRLFVFSGILLFVGNRFLLLGLLMIVFCLVAWGVAPVVKLARHLAGSPTLYRVRARATTVVLSLIFSAILLIGAIPFRVTVFAPGILKAQAFSSVSAETAGMLEKILVPPGTWVEAGTPLLKLDNPELVFQIHAARAQVTEMESRLRNARESAPEQINPLFAALQESRARLRELQRREQALTVLAVQDGIWSAPELESLRGFWFERGATIGNLTDMRQAIFHAVIPQSESSRIFGEALINCAIRLRGQSHFTLPVKQIDVVPGERLTLPGAALGWQGGGEVAVDMTDTSGLRSIEPFYELRARLDPAAFAEVALLHGRTGRMFFEFEPEPLLNQWLRRLRQLVQKRYRI
jgi:putative peptide zinc metalloprotease protein